MTDVNGRLAGLWNDLLRCGDVAPDADFFDSGGTSIAAVHLAALIQEGFGVGVDAIEIVTLRTFVKVADLITTRLAEAA